jgi:hypothetical protein
VSPPDIRQCATHECHFDLRYGCPFCRRDDAAAKKPDVVDTRQRMLEMASELARLAVALPPAPSASIETATLGRIIADRLRQLISELPKCDQHQGCTAPAMHRSEYPLDRGGEWPHACDAHKPEPTMGTLKSLSCGEWIELPYAVSLRALLNLLERKPT